ncbi:MAG TPA: diadenylate cyclase CdaA [Caldisericia bacterium]|nr:diadenylate cyclase CdaA [Caldisericia bacterium]HPF48151.1 diadenylate cyclase CdaA [Caldisericia bacterium]HPI83913.1 diadenylate cyclase CdaA [Caldisericia bacterium]HPQ92604.1 diadenylate cyclase CdaA [Caldisericia bacterium]HRV74298.1 diadenylate cyclase CdaA [Caldisericia bacterium]
MPLLDSLTQTLKSIFWGIIPKAPGSIPFPETLVDIVIIAILVYYILKVIQASKALQLFQGLAIFFLALVAANYLSKAFSLISLHFLIRKVLEILPTALPLFLAIIFQPELRKALGSLGQKSVFGKPIDMMESTEIQGLVREISAAVKRMSDRKIGAIIAIERQVGLGDYENKDTRINSEVNAGLIESIFNPAAPLHDGGIIIRGDRIAYARCVFPLSSDSSIDEELGTRHRAALGLSEETDAIIICVSETSGIISMATSGSLTRFLSQIELEGLLKHMISSKSKVFSFFKGSRADG